MKRTLTVVVIALAILVAGCGGPGEAPENETNDTETGANESGMEDDENASATLDAPDDASTPLVTASAPG